MKRNIAIRVISLSVFFLLCFSSLSAAAMDVSGTWIWNLKVSGCGTIETGTSDSFTVYQKHDLFEAQWTETDCVDPNDCTTNNIKGIVLRNRIIFINEYSDPDGWEGYFLFFGRVDELGNIRGVVKGGDDDCEFYQGGMRINIE